MYTGATQETPEWFSWQKQLNSLKTFTMGCLQEGLSQKSSEVNRAFHFASAGLEQVLGYLLDLLFLADARFWGNMGATLGFLCEAGVRSTTGQSALSLVPALCSSHCSMRVEMSLYILVA